MNDSIPHDPIRSLVDTSIEDYDENDDEDDDDAAADDRHEAREQHFQNQTISKQHDQTLPMRQQRQRQDMQILCTEASFPNANLNGHLLFDASHSNAVSITPVHYIPYVHGGYSAAAPLFVTHTKFAHILKKLLPGAYEELSILLRACAVNGGTTAAAAGGTREQQMVASSGGEGRRGQYFREEITDASDANHCDKNLRGQHLNIIRIDNATLSNYINAVDQTGKRTAVSTNMNGSARVSPAETTEVILVDPVKIMKWAENNPVVSAFGIWNSDSGRRTFTFMKGMMPTIRKVSNDDNDDDDDNDISCDYGDNTDDDCNHHTMTSMRFRAGMASGVGYNRSLNYGKRHCPIQRPKRRKQPLPEDLPSSSESSRRMFHVSPIVSEEPVERPPWYNKPALEWDVFLDPNLVRQVDAAMTVVDNLGLKLRKAAIRRERRLAATAIKRNSNNPYCKSMSTSSNAHIQYCKSTSVSSNADNSRIRSDGGKEVINDEEDDNDDFDLLQSHTAAEVEVDRLVSQLMRRTILAHGSMAQLVMEATGLAPSYNYGTVVKSSRDVSGNGSALVRTPSRPRKHHLLHRGEDKSGDSLNTSKMWDEKEEQHDFEALLNATVMNKKDGKSDYKGEKRRTGSQGMFMETWIHTFARTLTLLARSSNGLGGNYTTINTNSSNSSRIEDKMQLVEKLPGDVTQQQGFSGLIGKMFLRRESSVADLDIDTYDVDDDDSDMLTNHDMLSPTAPTSSSLLGNLCGMSLCLGMGGDNSKGGATSSFPLNPHLSHKMAQDIERISAALGEPLRLVLDLKSRRVPPRVWSRLIDSLRTQGLIIDGIGSFDMDELRAIGKGCSYPLTPILFFHSVGDLQRACHANEVKYGDHVYFNGGSLMWKRTSIMEAAERGCCGALQSDHGSTAVKSPMSATRFGGNYSFQPYAFPRSSLSDWERIMCKSTIEDYRRHFNLRIGVYVQEFSISGEALDALTLFINKHGEIYDQGLAFGGVNGLSVKNISGDGYWNQRYMGRSWDFNARPSNEMTPLKPEDHHLVQKALQTGAWGQVGTIFEVVEEGALTAPREPCDVINMVNSSF